jgi:hypothetical protein
MKRRLKEPFGKAGLTVAICALVLAMVGGAYAAGGLTKSQEKQVTKIAKKYAGKPGATGPQGAPGAAGTNGTNGKNGTNGTNGADGEEGSPWTAGGTLPSEASEKGDWLFDAMPNTQSLAGHVEAGTSISFGIPLADPAAITVHVIQPGAEGTGNGCPVGSTASNPDAEPGNLCLFISNNQINNLWAPEPSEPNVFFVHVFNMASEFEKVDAGGALVRMLANDNTKGVLAGGAWAVTAP